MTVATSSLYRLSLLLTSMVAGAATLALEVLAARAIAPILGSGSVTWSALLAVALGALAVGNLLGGLLAGRPAAAKLLTIVQLVAAAAVAVLGLGYGPVLRWVAMLPVAWAAITAALLTQLVPMLLLGLVSPILLHAAPARPRWSAAVLAVGSGGGILGALVTGLVILPALGIARCYLVIALTLTVGALVAAPRRWLSIPAVLVLAAVLIDTPAGPMQSRYGQVDVRYEDSSPVLLLDGLPQTACPGLPTRFAPLRAGYLLEAALIGSDSPPRSALVIGLGGGLAPRILEAHGIRCTVVELDPAVVAVARDAFGFDGKVVVGDGRAFLAQSNQKWDLIVLDVCTADMLAWHLFTREALELVRQRLAPRGVLAVQFIGDDGPWSAAVYGTARRVFSETLVLAPAGDMASIGPRWLLAGGLEPIPGDLDSSELPWRVWRAEADLLVMTDDHFAAEVLWSRTAQAWRAAYGRR